MNGATHPHGQGHRVFLTWATLGSVCPSGCTTALPALQKTHSLVTRDSGCAPCVTQHTSKASQENKGKSTWIGGVTHECRNAWGLHTKPAKNRASIPAWKNVRTGRSGSQCHLLGQQGETEPGKRQQGTPEGHSACQNCLDRCAHLRPVPWPWNCTVSYRVSIHR